MKVWLGVIGRACVEFAIILVLVSFASGAAVSVAAPSGGIRAVYDNSVSAALGLVPLAVILTLFLAFFSFELLVKSRAAGWLGLLLVGAVLFSGGIAARRAAFFLDAAEGSRAAVANPVRVIPAGSAIQQGRVVLWIGSIEGGEARKAVAVDFGSDYPRMAYAPRAVIDASGEMDIQGRMYAAAVPANRPVSLVPEASRFSGLWIWDRLAAMDDDPLLLVFATAGGFLFLAIGFRFLCRITRWPLANAILSAAGLAGLAALDAVLAGRTVTGVFETFATRTGLPLSGPLLLAAIECLIGLALAAADLASAPRGKKRLSE